VKKFLPTILLAFIAATAGMVFSNDFSRLFKKPEFANATLYPEDFRSLPEFSLSDHNGNRFTKDNLKNTWSILFFGFVNCPDVCPNTLAILRESYEKLGDLKADVQVIFLSVDPQRDTQELLKDYTTYFHSDFVGVTGELDALKSLTKEMSIHFEYHIDEANSEYYQVDHYSGVFVIDPTGKQHALISPPFSPGVIAQDIRTMIEFY